MDVVDLWRGRVATDKDGIFVPSSRHEHVMASRVEISISAEDMRVPMRERINVAWE